MTYPETIAWLNGLTDFERASGYTYDTKNFSLDRMRALLADLGNPHREFPSIIVAGTKGKGSTAAMLTSILGAAGFTTGLYTSPHLIEYPERIRIGLTPVSHEEFSMLAGRVAPVVERLAGRGADWRPTTFEAVTAMALLGFAIREVGAAILEIGLGGRLDAVNVVDARVVCLTSIGLDHLDQLGTTVEAIAAEKAGVIKSAAPVVTAGEPYRAVAVITSACREQGAPLTIAPPRTEFSVALAGAHQQANAAIAAAGARLFSDQVTDEAIRAGLRDVRWPGRLQVIAEQPTVLVDGAHTQESAEALAAAVRDLWKPVRVRLIFAMLEGKRHAEVAAALVPLAERVWCPALRHPRALPPEQLVNHVTAVGGIAVAAPSTAAALAAAREGFNAPGDLILVAGSLALAGEAMVS